MNNKEENRFQDSNMDIYVCGKFKPIMNALIAEVIEDNNIDTKYDNIMGQRKEKIFIDVKKDKLIDNNSKSIKETSLNKYEKESKIILKNNNNIDIYKFFDNLKDYKSDIINKNDFKIKNSAFNWNLHFYCKNGFEQNSIKSIKKYIYKDDFDFNLKNTLIIFVKKIEKIYQVIDIFDDINKDDQPLFLFIINKSYFKKENKEILDDIKNYINDSKNYKFNIRNIKILDELDTNKRIKFMDDENIEIENKKALNSYILNLYLFLIRAFFYYNNLEMILDSMNT